MGYIYKIENLANGKIYIGQTIQNIKKRFKVHKQGLKGNYHYNDHLQKSWNKHGEDNFIFVLLEELPDEKTDQAESFYIYMMELQNPDFGYNEESGGHLGKHLSPETKAKLSEAKKGEKNYNFGKPMSEETKAKISESMKGRPKSEETKAKMSESRKSKHHSGGTN